MSHSNKNTLWYVLHLLLTNIVTATHVSAKEGNKESVPSMQGASPANGFRVSKFHCFDDFTRVNLNIRDVYNALFQMRCFYQQINISLIIHSLFSPRLFIVHLFQFVLDESFVRFSSWLIVTFPSCYSKSAQHFSIGCSYVGVGCCFGFRFQSFHCLSPFIVRHHALSVYFTFVVHWL